MRISRLLGAMVLSLAITGVPAAAVATERTEGEKFANNYGYEDAADQLTGRTPQELSTQRALARLHRHHMLVIENQRTEGEKFANNYGYGPTDEIVVDRGLRADATRWQAQADALQAGRVAAVERTEGEKFANNYGFGTTTDEVAAAERTEGEKFANNYGYGPTDEIVVDRGLRADAARWQARADALQEGRVAASTPPSAPVDAGLPWEAIALSGSLMVLLAGATMAIVRHQPRSTV